MLHDIRLALRSLRRAPAFTTTTILTLALAAGANAAIFAVVYGVLLKPLPFPDSKSLVAVWPGRFQSTVDLIYTREHGRGWPLSARTSRRLRPTFDRCPPEGPPRRPSPGAASWHGPWWR